MGASNPMEPCSTHPEATMDSQQIFTDTLYRLLTSLEDIGLYPVDMSTVLTGEPHLSYEGLRSQIINHRTQMRFDVSCLVGDSGWEERPEESIFLKMADMKMEDIETLYRHFVEEETAEESQETDNNFD